jgi:Flp pilus assembly protein TadB
MPGWILRLIAYEINLPARQLHMYQYRDNIYNGSRFKPWLGIPNGLRLLLILFWVPLGVVLIALLVLEDGLVSALQLIVSILLCRYVRRHTEGKERRAGTELPAFQTPQHS